MRRFRADGYVHLPGVLTGERCAALRAEIDDAMEVYPQEGVTRWLRPRMHLSGPTLLSLIDQWPVVDIAEELLSFEPGERTDLVPDEQKKNCHVLNLTGMVTRPGDEGTHWHVDEVLMMPRPEGVPWDSRIPFPVYLLTAMYYLSPVDLEGGATELVPGSEKSGRKPDPFGADPVYEGRGRRTIDAAPGDCLLFHHQIWHRNHGVRPGRLRCVQQVHYGARFVSSRFGPFPNQFIPARVLDRLTPRQQRLLGMFPFTGQYT